ncbi:MAG: hypothetical protein U0900_04740 [Myxococcota bacterium]
MTANALLTLHGSAITSFEDLINGLAADPVDGDLRIRIADQVELLFRGVGAADGALTRLDPNFSVPGDVTLDIDVRFPVQMQGMQLDVSVASPLPEPGLTLLLGSGVGALVALPRRRMRS